MFKFLMIGITVQANQYQRFASKKYKFTIKIKRTMNKRRDCYQGII